MLASTEGVGRRGDCFTRRREVAKKRRKCLAYFPQSGVPDSVKSAKRLALRSLGEAGFLLKIAFVCPSGFDLQRFHAQNLFTVSPFAASRLRVRNPPLSPRSRGYLGLTHMPLRERARVRGFRFLTKNLSLDIPGFWILCECNILHSHPLPAVLDYALDSESHLGKYVFISRAEGDL